MSDETIHTRTLYHTLGNILPLTINRSGILFDGQFKSPAARGDRLLTKEPNTIHWLEEYLAIDDTFYDIGANVGMYCLFAAKKGNSVIAIEPESSTYAILNRNIYLNKLSHKISALNIALYDEELISHLNIEYHQPGKGPNIFDDQSGHGVHSKVETPNFQFHQSVIGMPLDTLVSRYNLSFPNAIKIDVDGNEVSILEGMPAILSDRRLKSIAIHIDTNKGHDEIISGQLHKFGFEMLTYPWTINPLDRKHNCDTYFFLREQ